VKKDSVVGAGGKRGIVMESRGRAILLDIMRPEIIWTALNKACRSGSRVWGVNVGATGGGPLGYAYISIKNIGGPG